MEGKSRCSGRVEIHDRDQWKTVCDSHFGPKDAAVVCRELQCGVALPVSGPAHFGEGVSPIWDGELQCVGNESRLISCHRGSSREQPCTHANSAIVTCTRKDSGTGAEHLGELQPEWGQVVPVETREVGYLFPQAGREVTFLGDPTQGRAGLLPKDKEGSWGGRAQWDHCVVPQRTQKGLKAEDKLGGGQGRLWSGGAGGFGEKQQCVLGGTLVGQVSSQGAGRGGAGALGGHGPGAGGSWLLG